MVTLHADQVKAKDELRAAFRQGYKRPLLVAPCGWGKGTVAATIILEAVTKAGRVIFLVNRKELVKDMVKRLKLIGLFPGVLMGSKSHGQSNAVLVASRDTLRNRLKQIPAPDLVIVDEAHMFATDNDQDLLDVLEQNGAKLILMTATPWLLSGKGMDQIADCMIEGPQIPDLITQGRLAEPIIYTTGQPEGLSAVHKTSDGELNEKESAEVMGTRKIIGDMVKHWKTLAAGKRTVGFAVNNAKSRLYTEAFNAAGIRSVAVDADTSDTVRDATWQRLRDRDVDVVWSVGIISYGWDLPEVECVIDAAPTYSLAKHLQRVLRAGRYFPGKKFFIILDHSGNCIRRFVDGQYGIPHMPRQWKLKGWKRKRGAPDEKINLEDLPLICPMCKVEPQRVLSPGTKVCPVCGYEFVAPEVNVQREIEHDETADLVKLDARVFIYPQRTGDAARDATITVAEQRGYKPAWVAIRNKALEKSREAYRETFMKEPKDYWTSAQINAMLRTAGDQMKIEDAEKAGLA